MGKDVKAPEGHVVVARAPALDDSGVASALYAVVAETPEQAAAAVQDVVAANTELEVTGGPLSSETIERLHLDLGHPKQIG